MSRRLTARAMTVAIVVVLLSAAGAFACTAARTSETGDPRREVAATDVPVLVALDDPLGPTAFNHGVPVGWRHDQRGAEAAAASFVRASALVAKAGPLERGDIVAVLATPAYRSALVESTSGQLDDLLFSLGERGLAPDDLVWSEHPLTLTSSARSDDVVEVRVWSVLIVGVEGGSAARQVWRTSELTMRWVDGDWKVDRWASTPGPLPSPPPEGDVTPLSAVLEVIAWPPAQIGSGS